MTKLEELSELLVSEIREFEVAVKKLEEIQMKKLNIDLSEFKKIIIDHKSLLESHNVATKKGITQFELLIKKAKIYPNWMVIVFIISLILNCVGVTIFFLRLN